ncbi:hypothetical protein PIB30_046004 [Stylosanthes scabra]|uniref:Uncharacterized protein n=1 Tax=Stylosanthes scabra TaxID=79078 RepID=A0ABU6VJ66_9FABA|nr:hypothetical protein [Stylosanthes scabra]
MRRKRDETVPVAIVLDETAAGELCSAVVCSVSAMIRRRAILPHQSPSPPVFFETAGTTDRFPLPLLLSLLVLATAGVPSPFLAAGDGAIVAGICRATVGALKVAGVA